MSKDFVKDIAEMHTKFGVNKRIVELTGPELKQFLQFRVDFLQEELDEMKKAIEEDNYPEITDALVDLVVVAVGTMDAFSVDAYTAWDRVHAANMSKQPGVKPSRPNPLGFPDLIKPSGWQAPNHDDNVGLLEKLSYK